MHSSGMIGLPFIPDVGSFKSVHGMRYEKSISLFNLGQNRSSGSVISSGTWPRGGVPKSVGIIRLNGPDFRLTRAANSIISGIVQEPVMQTVRTGNVRIGFQHRSSESLK